MTNMDLQEQTRMEDVYKDISFIIDKIGQLGVFPPLVWVWTWDVAKSMGIGARLGETPRSDNIIIFAPS